MATLSDVARIAGVSISAVSKVLSEAPNRVSDETRARIRQAAQELGYRPNYAGRALRFSRSSVIALIVPDLTNAVFTELMEGVEEQALGDDYLMLLARSEDMQPGVEMIERLLAERRVDGVLVQLADGAPSEVVQPLLAAPSPVVFVNSIAPGRVASVNLQDAEGAAVAVRHLVDAGHTRIGFVGGLSASYTARSREDGFAAAMAEAGLIVDPGHVTRLGYAPDAGRAALGELLAAEPMPTGIVVANINAAIGLIAEARVRSVRVPDDLSVVAVHDSWTAENTWPPLTTVRMPMRELGRAAVSELMELMRDPDGGRPVRHRIVSEPAPKLISRESVARRTPSAG